MVIVAAWEERAEVYLEPDYPSRSEQPAAESGGCFIATAAFGDPLAPEVILLSAFRDEVLNASGIGRAFIRLYYAASPSIAAVIAQSGALRRVAMALVVRPAVRLVQAIQVSEAKRLRSGSQWASEVMHEVKDDD